MRIASKTFVIFSALVGLLSLGRISSAQDRSYPTSAYFSHFADLYDGELTNALENFNDDLKGAYKTVNTRWIDSICYHTMCGESLYQMGQLRKAMEHYNAALNIYLNYPDWMIRVQFPATLSPLNAGRGPAPWGKSRRAAKGVRFPERMTVSVGKLDQSDTVAKGGVVQQAQLFPVCVQEICRCTAICLHRRRELLGPICAYDPLTKRMLIALQSPVTLPNHWSQAWVDVSLGIALLSDGQNDLAAKVLERSLLVSGQYDHPLTPWALLELGKLSMEKGDLNIAAGYLEEASYAGFDNADYSVIEETFRHGLTLHLTANNKGMFPFLATAIPWAKTKAGKQLYVSLCCASAENAVVMNATQNAGNAITEATRVITKRPMANGEMGARLKHVAALVQYQSGNTKAGDELLSAALDYKRGSGKWLYQISLAHELALDGTLVTKRMATGLYEKVLRDPQGEDWNSDPLESLSALTLSNLLPFEHWYELVRETNQPELALEIADRVRRRRFYSTLPLGGRLTSLRWILEAPDAALDPKSILQRQDLLVRYGKYAEFKQIAKQTKADLAKLHLIPESAEAGKQHAALLDQLGKVSLQQEAKLHEIAARREPANMVFPPLKKTKDVQNGLPDRTLLLMFFTTSRGTHAYLMSNQKYASWDVANMPAIEGKLVALLRDLGNYEANHEVPLKDIASQNWKKPAKEIMDLLVAGSKVNFGDGKFDELIIVPDGSLWYVPFEALQVVGTDKTESLLTRCRIRYAPTMGLATPNAIPRKTTANVAVVVGKMYLKEDPAVAQQAFEQYHKAIPEAVALKNLPGASSLFRTQLDGLTVHDDLNMTGGPYDWSPMQLDKSKTAGALGNWMMLPWGSPDYLLLPGYHTRAEAQMKGTSPGFSGSEIFLSVCGMMSTGTRTILLSRWRTGGASSYELVREFAKELPNTVADDAWQRSVQLVSNSPIIPDQEPRIQKVSTSEPPKAEHPFLWAGYMLVDSGVPPEKSDIPPKGPPTIKPLQPAVPNKK